VNSNGRVVASIDFRLAYSTTQETWAKPESPLQEQSRTGGLSWASRLSSRHIQQDGIMQQKHEGDEVKARGQEDDFFAGTIAPSLFVQVT
jgi:hypothetical protein